MSNERDEILAVSDRTIESVEVPEWGRSVRLKTMSGDLRDAFDTFMSQNKRDTFRAALLVRCICDANGERLFKDEDADALNKKSAAALERLFQKAWTMNGLGREAVESAKKD